MTDLNESRFDFILEQDKQFILAFNEEMNRLGYDYGGTIGNGYCWGKYMLIYRKTAARSQTVVARIYIRENGIALRFFLNKLDRHRAYLENAPAHIKEVFTGPCGDCKHCHNEKEVKCRFRKTYTLDGRCIEKCNGLTFEFPAPRVELLEDYLGLFLEFFAPKREKKVILRE